jgi:hypothetical protein
MGTAAVSPYSGRLVKVTIWGLRCDHLAYDTQRATTFCGRHVRPHTQSGGKGTWLTSKPESDGDICKGCRAVAYRAGYGAFAPYA